MVILKEGERKMLLSQAGDQQSLGSFSSFPLNEKLIYFPLSRKEKLIPNVLCILFAGVSLKCNSWGKCSQFLWMSCFSLWYCRRWSQTVGSTAKDHLPWCYRSRDKCPVPSLHDSLMIAKLTNKFPPPNKEVGPVWSLLQRLLCRRGIVQKESTMTINVCAFATEKWQRTLVKNTTHLWSLKLMVFQPIFAKFLKL